MSTSTRVRAADRDAARRGPRRRRPVPVAGSEHDVEVATECKLPIYAHLGYLFPEQPGAERVDPDDINRVALADAEANGIVFLDEIDKIAVSDVRGGSISREGVQRDLLPLIEGTTVATKYGPIKTDHILFIASGAFHVAKPADLLPELQGRLPIRVELKALTQQDFVRILSATRASLTEQYQALLGTLKQGTLIKSIRLKQVDVAGDPQEIDCRYEGIKGLVLRAEFVRKR